MKATKHEVYDAFRVGHDLMPGWAQEALMCGDIIPGNGVLEISGVEARVGDWVLRSENGSVAAYSREDLDEEGFVLGVDGAGQGGALALAARPLPSYRSSDAMRVAMAAQREVQDLLKEQVRHRGLRYVEMADMMGEGKTHSAIQMKLSGARDARVSVIEFAKLAYVLGCKLRFQLEPLDTEEKPNV